MRLLCCFTSVDIAQSFCLRYVAYTGLNRHSYVTMTAVFIVRRSGFSLAGCGGGGGAHSPRWTRGATRAQEFTAGVSSQIRAHTSQARVLPTFRATARTSGAPFTRWRPFANSGYSSQSKAFTCISGYSLLIRAYTRIFRRLYSVPPASSSRTTSHAAGFAKDQARPPQ